jgi:hypothetical protein
MVPPLRPYWVNLNILPQSLRLQPQKVKRDWENLMRIGKLTPSAAIEGREAEM